jgi:hypothetical protein
MTDPAYIYETLARYAFNDCLKADDPWGIAKQEKYNVFINEDRLQEAIKVLEKVFVGLLLRTKQKEQVELLVKLEMKIPICKTQNDFIQLMDKAFKICDLV